jgi:carboxyl-terminal processing protease
LEGLRIAGRRKESPRGWTGGMAIQDVMMGGPKIMKTGEFTHSRKPIGLLLFVLALGIAVGLVMGCQFLVAFSPSDKIPAEAEGSFRLIAEAWNTIQKRYVDQEAVKPQKITYGAISGMVDSLGDTGHSRFLTPDMVKQETNLSRGRLEGIGAEVQMKNNRLVIVAPMDGSPAQKAGLKPGEIILKVNGEDVSGLAPEEAVSRILGPPGTPVTLTVLNPVAGLSRNISILRARIPLHNVTWQFLPATRVAQVRISIFSKGVTVDLQKALKTIREDGGTSLILDLRNNPGGLLDEAVATASQFLREGDVVLEKDSAGRVTPVRVRPGGLAFDLPLVVLVNEGTASAPEIVAGALQDSGRARIVGEKTFGTGTVLQKISLSDGSALLLAVQEWLTPKGRTIWHRGILPDRPIPLPAEVSPLVPRTGKKITAREFQESGDIQLRTALELLFRPGEK